MHKRIALKKKQRSLDTFILIIIPVSTFADAKLRQLGIARAYEWRKKLCTRYESMMIQSINY